MPDARACVDRPLVYVAGPYSSDPDANTVRAIEVAEELLAAGHVTPFVPHLTHYWDQLFRHDVEFWYAYDLAVLKRCDAVLRLPGSSTGADREVAFAAGISIPVFETPAALHDWARDRAARA